MSTLLVPQITVLRGNVPKPFCSVMAKMTLGKVVSYEPQKLLCWITELKSRNGYIDFCVQGFDTTVMIDISVDPTLKVDEVHDFQFFLARGITRVLGITEKVDIVKDTGQSPICSQ